MGLPLPAPLVPIAAELGAVWPEADEVAMTAEGASWFRFSLTARSVTEDCRAAVARMIAENESIGLAAFGLWWLRVTGPAGHQPMSACAAETMSRTWLLAAGYVLALKVFVYEQLLAYATAKAAIALAETPAGPLLLVLAEYGEAITQAISEYVDVTLETIEMLGSEVAPILDGAMAVPVRVLNSRPLHQGRDRVVTLEDQAPIGERLARARHLSEFPADDRTRRRGDNFPDTAEPSSVIKDVGPDGTVKRYAVYDADGHLVKRIDVVGRSHKGVYGEEVPTPHVVYYRHNLNPKTGESHTRHERSARPVHPEEIP